MDLPGLHLDLWNGPSLPLPQVSVPTTKKSLVHARTDVAWEKEADQVATRFEAMFWSMLIKDMREGLEPGVMLGEDGGDVLGGMFDMTMGDHLAKAHGLGIAVLVRQQLEKDHASKQHSTTGAGQGKQTVSAVRGTP